MTFIIFALLYFSWTQYTDGRLLVHRCYYVLSLLSHLGACCAVLCCAALCCPLLWGSRLRLLCLSACHSSVSTSFSWSVDSVSLSYFSSPPCVTCISLLPRLFCLLVISYNLLWFKVETALLISACHSSTSTSFSWLVLFPYLASPPLPESPSLFYLI